MSIDNNIYDKIKAYLGNEMTNEDRTNFELEIKYNPDLKDTISIFKTMAPIYSETDWALYDGELKHLKETSNLFKGEAIEAFSKQIKNASNNYNAKKKKSTFIKYISSLAAAIVILFSGYHFLNTETTSLELYNNYYTIKDLPSFTTKNDTLNTLVEAETFYIAKQYKKALNKFKLSESYMDSKLNPNLTLYIAICYIELNEYNLALERLNVLLKSDSLDAHKAYWFMALSYLKQNNKTKVIETLELLIKDENNFNFLKAKKLLNELK